MVYTRSLFALAIAFLGSGCSITREVHGLVAGEVYTGTATAVSGSASMEMGNGNGMNCIGQSVGNLSGGMGMLTCNDGVTARIQYTNVSLGSGHGFGVTSDGRPVRFTYGMSRADSAKYLGPQIAAATPGGGAGAGPSPGAGASPSPGAAPSAPGAPLRRRSSGTGFFIDRQGHLVTNAHVVDGCKEVSVTPPGLDSIAASVTSVDKANDLAVITATQVPHTVATLRGPQMRPGESVVAYGFPYSGALSSGGVLTTGIVNALTGIRDDVRFLQFSAPIQPGNSGGPLFDSSGAVVGVTTSALKPRGAVVPQNVNFAVKAELVMTFLAAAGLRAEISSGSGTLSTPDIGDRARSFTVLIECKV